MTRLGRTAAPLVVGLSIATAALSASAASASASAASASAVAGACSLSDLVSTACPVATAAGQAGAGPSGVEASGDEASGDEASGQSLLGGPLAGALGGVTGGVTTTVAKAAGMAAIGAAVAAVATGAGYALTATAKVIGATTRPDLASTWFSASYWRMAAVSALLTLPFLFAAAVQAIMRSDLLMLVRAAFGYLPLGLLAVGIAAPVTMLMLAGTDEMSALVSSAAGQDGGLFLEHAGALAGLVGGSTSSLFVAFLVGLLTIAAAIALWVELLIRDAAVYVIVLMLPLFFAALVWPARRIWAIRAIETLVALILSKFVIVAVLALGGAALGQSTIPGIAGSAVGVTLVVLAAFSPWALLRLMPLHDIAGAAAGGLGSQAGARMTAAIQRTSWVAETADGIAAEIPRRLGDWTEAEPVTDAASVAAAGDGATRGEPASGHVAGAGLGGATAGGATAGGADAPSDTRAQSDADTRSDADTQSDTDAEPNADAAWNPDAEPNADTAWDAQAWPEPTRDGERRDLVLGLEELQDDRPPLSAGPRVAQEPEDRRQ
ncbi:MAG: hypothetical protein ACLP50_27740 [Solirubrobacteraceae bacterium]